MDNRFFPEALVRSCIVAPDPRPRDLGSYRIFSDVYGNVFLAARLDGDRITIIAETDDEAVALNAVLYDASLRVPVLEREMRLGDPSYEPEVRDRQ